MCTSGRPDPPLGYPEIVEVLHGEAGFLIQDLTTGPSGPVSGHAWLVRARPGDWVILPPELAHVTIDLGAGPLVFSDVIDRRATGIYAGVADARGFAWYVGADGRLRANPRYERHADGHRGQRTGLVRAPQAVGCTRCSGTIPPGSRGCRSRPGSHPWHPACGSGSSEAAAVGG